MKPWTLSPFPLLRSRARRAVERDGGNDDNALDYHLPNGGDIDEGHAVEQHADEDGAERADQNAAGAAGQRDASDDGRSDRIELISRSEIGDREPDLRNDDDAGERRAGARDRVGRHPDARDGNRRKMRGREIAADRMHGASKHSPPFDDVEDREQDEENDDRNGQQADMAAPEHKEGRAVGDI